MTTTHRYRLRLVKDAELGTGLGSQSLNGLVPRDSEGWPVIPASHLKGLMRAALKDIAEPRIDWQEKFGDDSWPAKLLDVVFGGYNQQTADRESAIRLSEARIPRPENYDGSSLFETRAVARTAIGERGIADEHSLRTTEAIPRETEFHGVIYSDVDSDSIEGLGWRLALLNVNAVGGSRNRGGQCLIDLLAEDGSATQQRPGELLKLLNTAIQEERFDRRISIQTGTLPSLGAPDKTAAVVELLFVAESPVCCPEQPDKSNVIASGFTIPASAVQGVVLNHINRRNPRLATELFESEGFRCWPLNPCAHPKDPTLAQSIKSFDPKKAKRVFEELPYAIRVSLSHRVAKFSQTLEYNVRHFFDGAFADRSRPLRWQETPDGAPLKAADGALLFGGMRLDAPCKLWRAADMPRQITTHGVLDGTAEHPGTLDNGRNLYSVDAMAPLVWRGMISVPENVADALIESLNSNPEAGVGKSRTVRGLGKIAARRMPDDAPYLRDNDGHEFTVLVLQSPALIPSRLTEASAQQSSAEELLKVIAADWLAHFGLPGLAEEPAVWGNVGIRFGWNRHAKNPSGRGSGFQQAMPVLLPGSAFALKSKADPQKLREAILSGFRLDPKSQDEGRTRGFGALAVHPGKAHALYTGSPRVRRVETTEMREAIANVLACEQLSHLPSPSQIRGVEQRIRTDGTDEENQKSLESARKYLDDQCKRIMSVYYDWERAYDPVCKLLTYEPAVAKKSLISLAEIAIAKQSVAKREGTR